MRFSLYLERGLKKQNVTIVRKEAEMTSLSSTTKLFTIFMGL
ncbi:hypothetical protein SAMN04488057_104399 [Cyclobacterium lianum]|uniref:Uncharacterized protein n=1 Tax=Cyclobacterium lianum TaxID=388280 RepID=A0A1M7MNI0_9BACT|nr:hypothetical protein SAMN04488057_104399 [Cyclobacterium lianum]